MSLVQAAEAPLSAVVFTKAIDPELKYPLRTEQLLHALREKLGKFSSNNLQSVLFKERWKKGTNEYHRKQRNPDTAKFSHAAADTIVQKALEDGDYVARCCSSYNAHLRKTQAKKEPGKKNR